jgi:5-methylcytosine-specific restriction endonuclease McrA
LPTRPPIHRPSGWKPSKPSGFYQTEAWRSLAASIIRRDRGICHVCHRPGATTAHHLVDRQAGGRDEPSNLVAVHSGCHNKLHRHRGE